LWPGYLEEGGFDKLNKFIEDNNMSFHQIHTSGHASPPTLNRVVNKINPAKLFPIHTLNPEEYNQFNSEVIKLKNGESYKL